MASGISLSRRPELPQYEGDLDYAQAQYELGVKSMEQIAREIGRTSVYLFRVAAQKGWAKDSEAQQRRLRAKAQQLATAEQIRLEKVEIEKEKAELVTVAVQADLLVRHRTEIGDLKGLMKKLVNELRYMTDEHTDLATLGAEVAVMSTDAAQRQQKLTDLMSKILSLPDRVDLLRKIVDTSKTLLQLERQAYGITGAIEDPDAPAASPELIRGMDEIKERFNRVLAGPPKVVEVTDVIVVEQQ